jgi:hypothetical protein
MSSESKRKTWESSEIYSTAALKHDNCPELVFNIGITLEFKS